MFHGQDDEREERYDGDQSQDRGAQSEKRDGPEEIERQLEPKIIPRYFHFFLLPAQLPNTIKRYTHHHIEQGPDRAKDPIRRGKWWFDER